MMIKKIPLYIALFFTSALLAITFCIAYPFNFVRVKIMSRRLKRAKNKAIQRNILTNRKQIGVKVRNRILVMDTTEVRRRNKIARKLFDVHHLDYRTNKVFHVENGKLSER